jgi:hypothetical protein
LVDSLKNGIPQVSERENEILIKPFSKEEVKKAIFDMGHNKASGPDGFQLNSIRSFGKL